MPEEVRAAKRINSEGERIIEKAQEEAERIIARAQEQAAFLIEERGLTAGRRGREPPDHRRGRGRGRRGPPRRRRVRRRRAVGLEGEVVRTLQSIKKGIALLDERAQPPAALRAGPATTDGDEADGVADEDVEDEEEASLPAAGDDLRAARDASGRPPGRPLTFTSPGCWPEPPARSATTRSRA